MNSISILNNLYKTKEKFSLLKSLSLVCCIAIGSIAGFAIGGFVGIGFGALLGLAASVLLNTTINYLLTA